MEVDEVAKAVSREFQVTEHLRREHWKHVVDCLDFDDHLVFHHEIEAKCRLQTDIPIHNRYSYLGHYLQASALKLVGNTIFQYS